MQPVISIRRMVLLWTLASSPDPLWSKISMRMDFQIWRSSLRIQAKWRYFWATEPDPFKDQGMLLDAEIIALPPYQETSIQMVYLMLHPSTMITQVSEFRSVRFTTLKNCQYPCPNRWRLVILIRMESWI